MRSREIEKPDIDCLKAIHAESGLEYDFPDLESPQFISKRVIVDDSNNPLFAAGAKITVEIYGWCKPGEWETPGMKMMIVRQLHEEMIAELRAKGYAGSHAHAWISPQLKRFMRHMVKMFGWVYSSGPKRDWVGIVREI